MRKRFIASMVAAIIITSATGTVQLQAAVVNQAMSVVGSFQVIQSKEAVAQGKQVKVPVYGAGMYKVGQDLPAGEYLVQANAGESCYFQVSTDSTGKLESVTANENISSHAFITVKNGQYLKVETGTFADAQKLVLQKPQNGIYGAGTYRIGIDIPAGEYQITATASPCYVAISKDSAHVLESIVSNDNFNNSTYVTVKNGQYLTVTTGQFKVKNQAQAYWTSSGKSYHFTKDCVSLKNVKSINQGSVQQAVAAGKPDACNLCAGGTETSVVVSTGTAPASQKSTSAQNNSAVTPEASTTASTTPNKEAAVQKVTAPEERVVYWGATGEKIHTNPNCRSFKGNSPNSGTEEQAVAAGRTKGYCKVC